ncbi:MAG: DUF2207 domain-containing protein [Acidobacteriota bacterium]
MSRVNILPRSARARRSPSARGNGWAQLMAIALLLVATPGSTPLEAKSAKINWPLIRVDAQLDAEGRLHVKEDWTMVFNGRWNGGERTFNLRIGQTVELRGLTRIDLLDGHPVPLLAGSIDAVDQYDWTERHRLRWRSRLATDPGFENEKFRYILEYTLSGILREVDGAFRLDHDFIFTERVGRIEHFVLDLELDPAWQAAPALPTQVERFDLMPKDGVRLTSDLTYLPAGWPATVPQQTPVSWRLAAFATGLALMALLGLAFWRHEAERGRFETADAPETLDRAWLEEHLLTLRPEEAGGLWDRKIGTPEVAAAVARMVAEGKLASSVEKHGKLRKRQVLALELLVDRSDLSGYERLLIDKLFFEGRTRTDTEAVREHYRVKGFNPAAVIRPALEARLAVLRGPKPEPPSPRPTWMLWLAVLVALVLEGFTRGERALVVIALMLLFGFIPMIVSSCFVTPYRRWTRNLGRAALGMALPALVLAVLSWAAALQIWPMPDLMPGIFGVLSLAILPPAALSLWLHLARTRESRQGVRRHHQMAAVRRLFAIELERPEPDLDDAWFPYVLAFGLDKEAAEWFERHGGESDADYGTPTISASSDASPRWTGGGGAFGGAGASASWGAAAAGLAAGVASPTTSGSTGSSSGSFSGGGGGGGW